MSSGSQGRYRTGETALLARVAAVESAVERWRLRFDTSAAEGIPAHVTVLAPFLDISRCDTALLDELRAIFGAHDRFTVRFERCGRFPEVLYLVPDPEQPFRALTSIIAARWPEAPPYGGKFADVIPHLTIAHGQPLDVLDEVEAALTPELPLVAVVSSVSLFVSDRHRWTRQAEFPLNQ